MSMDDEDTLDKTSVMTSDTFRVRLAQAGQSPPCLVLLVGPANQVGRQWPLEDTDRVIGRAHEAHVCIEDKSVSKAHAKLQMVGGDVSIMDLESTNNTVVNGEMLNPLRPLVLKNNDQIKLGNVILKFLEEGNIETVSVAQTFDRGQMDALTEIYNKGALMARAPESFNKSSLLGVPYCIITFDIDHFKQVNDTHGHAAGDYILQELANVVKSKLIRENDFFARSGGEEFTLLLLGTPFERAQEISERLRETIESHDFIFEAVQIPITISVGVSSKRDDDSGWETIFDRADKALYKSKEGGRNRVTAD
ncbi:MAG: GGDEF domain-containing protein [Bdellovibrionaceae bacterium]|nr:GGDEF domain-containing protein [Pseudobdellovibrionaceae bacterium]